ncbi:MAG: hypothetical protein QM714_17340 [Nocardioides sp.]|uniref:hypothetical protein n=1 Tax=Nocardioides sp. TaxID=35761 RepID=UPI0039E57274
MRILRWASDKVTSGNEDERLVALSVLEGLDNSKPVLLQDEDQGILDAVLVAVFSDARTVVAEYPDASGNYDVKVVDHD